MRFGKFGRFGKLRGTRVFWTLAVFAFAVLGAAAVWLGGLNQDEGWYLYAANLVAEGKVLYRDFFYTQGPEMPNFYGAFTWIWESWGLLGARVFTLMLGFAGIVIAAALARRLAPEGRKGEAALVTFLLLGCNLYHLYYVAIPKTYALASMFVMIGFFLLCVGKKPIFPLVAGLALAYAAGTRISLGAILCVVGLWLLLSKQWKPLLWFCVGGFGGLALVYGPCLCDAGAREGLIAAQHYHAARGGFDIVWAVGSVSRLVRWYLPVFVVLGLGVAGKGGSSCTSGQETASPLCTYTFSPLLLLWGFLAVFAVQMLAPFPYEDYQVPIMCLLAVYAAVTFTKNANPPLYDYDSRLRLLLVLGLCFANSFGSPLLEKWMTNGQDRFWSLKKEKCELAQLRDVAKRIEAQDPGGKTLLSQDLYLAIETGRTVPKGLEMGPFAMMSDENWKKLLTETAPAECKIAALSGYAFAIEPPVCNERSVEKQMEYWTLLKQNYKLVDREEAFGQNATTLLMLKRK